MEVLLVASQTIGRRARWMMGCHCHESVLQGIKDYSARRISVGVVGAFAHGLVAAEWPLFGGKVDNIVDDIARLPLRMDVRFLRSYGQKRAVLWPNKSETQSMCKTKQCYASS